MANNDKLKQIISNLQNLTDLTVRMKDSELYPVSFFSSAFDLIQKVKNGFHTLETDQVELFTSQMKKHQDLIMSIHQQMRNIENLSDVNTSFEIPKPLPAPATEHHPQPPIDDSIPSQDIDTDVIKAVEKKPVKFTLKESKPPISTPIVIPDKKIAAMTPKAIPDQENSVTYQSLSLNDAIEKNKLSDLRKAFNLNDHFRYQRELFGSREDIMSKAITELNKHRSLKESLTYLKDTLHWELSDPTVIDFIKKLEIRFL